MILPLLVTLTLASSLQVEPSPRAALVGRPSADAPPRLMLVGRSPAPDGTIAPGGEAARPGMTGGAWPRIGLPDATSIHAAPPAPVGAPIPGSTIGAGPGLGGTGGRIVGAGPKPSPVPGQDCNGNGINDAYEIWVGTAQDCQGDGIPDECQLATALTYLRDDGIMNLALTWPHDHLAWLTGHEVQPGHELVTEVQVAWGAMPTGSSATVALWADPDGDGDPADAVPLMELQVVSSEEFTGNPVSIDVPDTDVGPAGARFFVGVIGSFDQSWFPVGFDSSIASLTSYLVASDTPIQSDDLLAGAVGLAGVVGDGDWMVRAISCPSGHCGESVDVDFSGAPDECEPQDCNGNSVPDDVDIALGSSQDCNGDAIPDECQVATGVVYSDAEVFSGGVGTAQDHYAWLTQSVVEPGGETITSIEIAHGSMEAAAPLTVGLWSDPDGDGDPTDAQLLVSVETLSAFEFTGEYIAVNIPDTPVGPPGTSFFVGAFGQFDQSWFAAGFDVSGSDQRSWFISADMPIDPDDLSAGADEFELIDTLCCEGDWTLRAVACPTGHCGESADLNGNQVPDECDPDCNGNGVPDDLDILLGTETDCDGNGLPDSCDDLADCDGNGLPDLCQAITPTGLVGEYYPNEGLFGAPLARIDQGVDFDFDVDPPFPGGFPTDHFSVRWTGALFSTVAGTYTFGVLHDDGVRLWVNGKLLIDEWHPSGGDLDTATIELAGATEYHLRLEYYEGNGGAVVQLLWQPPGGSLLPMLSTDLAPIYDRNDDGVPDGCQVPDCNGNGVDDVDDILFGTSLDIDGDLTPDECEPCEDCDGNRYPDAFEQAAGPGLIGQYWSVSGGQVQFLDWYFTAVDPTIDFSWGGLGPAGLPLTDQFGVRWTGTLTTPAASGAYAFHVQADDGVRLWLDGVLLIDEWHPAAGSEYDAVVDLAGGTEHMIRLDYYEAGGDAQVHLLWTVPGGVKEVVPSTALEPHTDLDGDGVPDACTADCDLDGLIDALEADLNGNCVPDDCEDGSGYWRFEEAGGSTALDATLSGMHGTLNSLPVRVPDVPVSTVPLTGADDLQALSLEWQGVTAGGLVSVPDVGGLLSVADISFTLEAWIRLDQLSTTSNSGQRQWLFMKKPGGSSDAQLEYGLLVQSGDLTNLGSGPSGRELLFRYGDGAGVYDLSSQLVIDDLDWHFVSVAYDAVRHELRFGLDGDFDLHLLHKPAIANAGPLLIGAHENQSAVTNQFLRGAVDEVRFTRAFLPPGLLLDHTP